jgi:membrane protein YqaA with SNARE-associated domain
MTEAADDAFAVPAVVPDVVDDDTANDTGEVATPFYGWVALAGFVALVVAGWVAGSVAARWAFSRPEQLLMLSSRNRFLVMALANDIDPWSYAIIGTLRVGAAALVCHLIGRAFGDRAVTWFVRYLGIKRPQANQLVEQFDRIEIVLVPFFVGSNFIWAITGIARSSWYKLVVYFAVGVAARFALLWWLAARFESQLDTAMDFILRYQTPTLIVSTALVVFGVSTNFRRGRNQ